MSDADLPHAARALVEIIRTSKAALDVATADLKAEPTPTALEQCASEADVLSRAIAALGKATDLSKLTPTPLKVSLEDSDYVLDKGLRIVATLEAGCFCARCGGVPRGDWAD